MSQQQLSTFGQRLHDLRLEAQITQKAMAEYLGCTASNYQKMEYGQVNVSATTLIALAEQFRVSTDYLLGLRDQP
nr:helix-turn-helix transcriptional regulator [uncultured Dysosmobacter sp.]